MTVQYGEGNLAARATFAKEGNNLVITLENIATAGARVPSDVLTGVSFRLDGVTFETVRVGLTDGSSILFPGAAGLDPDGDGLDSNGGINMEWGFRDDLDDPSLCPGLAEETPCVTAAGAHNCKIETRWGPPHRDGPIFQACRYRPEADPSGAGKSHAMLVNDQPLLPRLRGGIDGFFRQWWPRVTSCGRTPQFVVDGQKLGIGDTFAAGLR